ncbi:hypothetical protein U0C82_07415 [Fulvimarina sp. 2208YS6-2-32]|uniref:Uncharacterized protein n=1 Tax=Fulvimarina uroteuthidis TaxID=3098149 RepID=A0ABU5I2C4_9HYPH|nr:hypothetical protein [Fulvimarina sp. 2208YS6-2-32]MDY8108969.1 hypothetical protein [Fulvimarina sp. 2208YS6-2-32]
MQFILHFLRLLGTLCLAIATVFAVGDIARYVADDIVRMATIAEIAQMTGIGAGLFAGGSATAGVVGGWPFALSVAVLGMVLTLLGRKRRRIGRT